MLRAQAGVGVFDDSLKRDEAIGVSFFKLYNAARHSLEHDHEPNLTAHPEQNPTFPRGCHHSRSAPFERLRSEFERLRSVFPDLMPIKRDLRVLQHCQQKFLY